MYMIIDINTLNVVHKGTLFMNQDEYLDIDIEELFSDEVEYPNVTRDIKVSDSLIIRPLVATEKGLRLLIAKAITNFRKDDIEVFVDACSSKIEFPSEFADSVEPEYRFSDSKHVIFCMLLAAIKCAAFNGPELLKRILDLEINTNIPFQELELLSSAFGMGTAVKLLRFIRDFGYETKMELLIYMAFSYYSICWDREELINFLKDSYPGVIYQQMLFDAAIRCRNGSLVQEYFFKVEPSSENIRKMTEMAYESGNVDIVKFLLKNSDKLECGLDENVLKTAIKKKDYDLAKEIINKYPNIVDVSCLEGAVESGNITVVKLLIKSGVDLFSSEFQGINIPIKRRDVDMLRLFLENGVSVKLVDQRVIEQLCSIKNYEIAERLLDHFDKDKEMVKFKTPGSQDKVGTKLKFSKAILCLIEVRQSYDQYNPNSNVEFDEFIKHLDLYEKVMMIVNSKRKDIADVFYSYHMGFCFMSLRSNTSGDCYDKLVEIIGYIVENDLQSTFEDTENNKTSDSGYGGDVEILNDRHYELAKLELVNRNFELLKLLTEHGMNISSAGSLILKTAYKSGDIGWINYFISKGAKLKGGSDGFEDVYVCKSNSIDVLQHWIKNGGVVPKNPEYECINMACLLGNFDMVKLLVENGVDLSDPGRNGVRIACRLDLKRTLKYLLDNNAVIKAVQHHQLEYACLVEDIGLVKIILEHYDGLGVLEKRENTEMNEGNELQNDSFLNLENTDGIEEYRITKALLEKGEPIQNNDLFDGVIAAVALANVEILKLLLSYKFNHNGDSKILQIAVQTGNTDVVELLLEDGFSIEDNPDTLNIALEAKSVEMIKFLLKLGAKVDKYSHYLAEYSNLDDIETLRLILNHCPDIGDDSLLLLSAVRKNKVEAVSLALEYMVTLANGGYNYILDACKNNNLEILKMLFEKGAKIRKGYESGVIQACGNNNLEILRLLLERNPNLVLGKDYGLKEAYNRNNEEMIKLLIKYGANASVNGEPAFKALDGLTDHNLFIFSQRMAMEL
ncbi:putative ankyrin repeat protein L63 [Zancudomyces culisetae]|uniref:Putative ankyrin repeat protein L63 n=1 Tax=Zancudomyces culisetae TaxID=1213189 RepID=A0A1R1PTC5_ZANCU|nr:putative ankyrin repeat protein L63 [Zancudomyces culisetae]|eukprot:OMH84218.1 putative ankyrin repeat protein L63 [Zancudomyces culisetae]